MMDCSKTEVFLAELKRMCANVGGCYKCEIYKLLEPHKPCIGGGGAFAKEPEKCIEIVQEWSDQHPVRTRLSVLKEQYPNLQFRLDGTPRVCCTYLYNTPFPEEGCTKEMCVKCWNTPIEGVQL